MLKPAGRSRLEKAGRLHFRRPRQVRETGQPVVGEEGVGGAPGHRPARRLRRPRIVTRSSSMNKSRVPALDLDAAIASISARVTGW